MILLDTNVLIDLDRYVFDGGETCGASILSRAELEFGVRAATSPDAAAARRRRLNELDALHRHGAAVMTAKMTDIKPFDHLARVGAPRCRG